MHKKQSQRLIKKHNRYLPIAVLFFVLIAFYCCKHANPIYDWECKRNCAVIDVIQSGPFVPFYAGDSAKLADVDYELLKKIKITSLQIQIDSAKIEYQRGMTEAENIKNATLKKHYSNQVKLIEQRVAMYECILTQYSDTSDYNQLWILKQTAHHYRRNQHEIIGYRKTVTLTIRCGQLPESTVTKMYLYSKSKQKILAELAQ